MSIDQIATDLYNNLKNKIQKCMTQPPKYEKIILSDGYYDYSYEKPRFTLASLGYDYTQYTDQVNIRRLEKIKEVLNHQLNKHLSEEDFDGYIRVDYEVPHNKTKPITNIFQQIQSEFEKDEGIINKNTDYIFVVTLP